MTKTFIKSDAAEVIALQALTFLAADTSRLERFLALTGTDPASLAGRAREPDFLAAVLDHVLGDESLLFLFCEAENMPVDAPRIARRALPGGGLQD